MPPVKPYRSTISDCSIDVAAEQAEAAWCVLCGIAATHIFGLTWPPPQRAQRSRVVGHWGTNPGIAWITAHLATWWTDYQPFLIVVGTGHATSFLVAHEAIRAGWSSANLSEAARIYGQGGGVPSELIGWPAGLPYVAGELGPTVALSQALAAEAVAPLVVSVVGDGECETAVALAGFAHAEVLFRRRPVAWLPVINANGARMGGPARFSVVELANLMTGMGYRAIVSGADAREASGAAYQAITAGLRGERVVWISQTDKGWPAPSQLGGVPFRGANAHKPPRALDPTTAGDLAELVNWLDPLTRGQFGPNGQVDEKIRALVGRSRLTLDPVEPLEQLNRTTADVNMIVETNRPVIWRPPVSGADICIAESSAKIFSPDEARSNGLYACEATGSRLVEVLSEEVCAAWSIGTAEAGRPAVFATYEAFAPLASTQLAQYAKLVHTRASRNTPPVIVLQTSLGWANTPTHQNSDLVATFVARPLSRVRVVCPIGADSARTRVGEVLHGLRDGVALVTCSKQPLLDLPDPGGAIIEIIITEAPAPVATIVAVGDVCVTESVAAMTLAAQVGISLRVLAVIDLSALDRQRDGGGISMAIDSGLALGVVWCAARILESLLWDAAERRFPVHGYRERSGSVPWETLQNNRIDRYSLLDALSINSIPDIIDPPSGAREDAVPHFAPPPLTIRRYQTKAA